MLGRTTPPLATALIAVKRDLLLDVSRLIWRTWAGRLPTGIDRVCLAYLERFAGRSQAVVQRGNLRRIATPALSDALFGLLLEGGARFRSRVTRLAMRALVESRTGEGGGDRLYLNVGHTGLNAPGLVDWTSRAKVRPVYLIHDLIPITHPEFCRAGEEARHRLRMENALASARGIIGNSQATLADLAAFGAAMGLPSPPALAAWLGAPPLHAGAAPIRRERPYFVVLGTIEGRKNHALLLQLWRRMIERDASTCPDLVIIGQRGWEAQAALAMLDRLPLIANHVQVIEDCTDGTLAGYLRGCRALLMPSFAEGYGLPVIEALGLGAPVIASDLPVFRELAGERIHYCDPLDGPGWLDAIGTFLSEPDAAEAAAQPFHMPSWDDHFARVEPWMATL
ncbi:glycosyltransferase family 4 protein [Sphingomonas sp. RS6]